MYDQELIRRIRLVRNEALRKEYHAYRTYQTSGSAQMWAEYTAACERVRAINDVLNVVHSYMDATTSEMLDQLAAECDHEQNVHGRETWIQPDTEDFIVDD